MKLLLLVLLSIVFGLLFHAVMHVCTSLLGPIPPESAAAFPARDVGCLATSSLVAAAIVTAGWRWRYEAFALREAFAVGAMSIVLIVANVVFARGPEGLPQMLAARPVHMAASFALAFFAVPICAWIADARGGRRADPRGPFMGG